MIERTGRGPRIHRAAVIVVVALACLALFPPPLLDGLVTQLEIALATFGASAVLVITSPRPVRRVILPLPLLAVLLVMGASVLWSIARSQTVHDVAIDAVLAAAAILLVSCAELDALAAGVVGAGLFVLLWSAVIFAIDPSSALNPVGAFTGVYGNRNALAYMSLQSAAAALGLRGRTTRGRIMQWASVAALSLTVVATRSLTSIAVLLMVLAVVAFLTFYKSRVIVISLGAVCVAAIVYASLNFGPILASLGKGTTLNGRLPIWNALFPVIAERPVLGYGWTLSWPTDGPPSASVTHRLNGVVLYHAHNEVLNWVVTTGIVGALLVLVLYASIIVTGARLLRRTDPMGWWLLIGGLTLLLRGLTEISETTPQGWFVLSILAAATAVKLVGETRPFWAVQARPIPLTSVTSESASERPTAHE